MNHQEIREQIPLYALGGMPAQDAARVAEHLDICPGCRAELSEYQFIAAELLEQIPAATAPARIGVRLQNLAQADANRAPIGNATASDPYKRVPVGNARRSVPLPRWAFALTLLAVLLLLGVTGLMAFRLQTMNSTTEQLSRLLAARDLRYVNLLSSGATADDKGYICIEADNSTGLLWLYGLKPLDQNHVYQVWLHTDILGEDGGTFRPDKDGRAVALVHAAHPLNQYRDIGITIEPAAGSTAPTSPRIIGGRID